MSFIEKAKLLYDNVIFNTNAIAIVYKDSRYKLLTKDGIQGEYMVYQIITDELIVFEDIKFRRTIYNRGKITTGVNHRDILFSIVDYILNDDIGVKISDKLQKYSQYEDECVCIKISTHKLKKFTVIDVQALLDHVYLLYNNSNKLLYKGKNIGTEINEYDTIEIINDEFALVDYIDINCNDKNNVKQFKIINSNGDTLFTYNINDDFTIYERGHIRCNNKVYRLCKDGIIRFVDDVKKCEWVDNNE